MTTEEVTPCTTRHELGVFLTGGKILNHSYPRKMYDWESCEGRCEVKSDLLCAWDGCSFRHWSQRVADRSEKYFLAFVLEDWLDWKNTKYLENVHFYYKNPLNSHLHAHEQSAETSWEIQATIYTEAGQLYVVWGKQSYFFCIFYVRRKPQ